jgi:ABC-type branched-subunit amino acid transport system substrate-binding protein
MIHMHRIAILLLGSGIMTATPAKAQDAYVIGLSGALTGPPASSYAPVVDGLRIYIDRLNAKGGVNGKPIRLIIKDDQAEASKGAANVKQLLSQEKVILMMNTSLSSTYAPMVAETKRAGVPLMFVGAVCPKEVFPPAQEYQFCTTSLAPHYDSRAALTFMKEKSTEPIRLGLTAMAVPVSREEIDYADELTKSMQITMVDKEVVPPPTPDYTPFASKIADANANWVWSWAVWPTSSRMFESLRKLGWKGNLVGWAHMEAERELARIKDEGFYAIGGNSFFKATNEPVHQEIIAAANEAKLSYPPEQLTEGWIAGMVVEAALKATSWPPTPAKVLAALNNLKVDMRGLRGGPIEWSATNHFRAKQYYRVYHWDSAKGAVVLVQDWMAYDIK